MSLLAADDVFLFSLILQMRHVIALLSLTLIVVSVNAGGGGHGGGGHGGGGRGSGFSGNKDTFH